MTRLFLSEDAVFPVIKDSKGNFLKNSPGTNIKKSGTVQGEGKLVGVPSLFVRLAGCNLSCKWTLFDGTVSFCDTSYANNNTGDSSWFGIDEVINLVLNNISNIKHLVITGGEPLLQKEALVEFCHELKEKIDIHITLETNGTIAPAELAEYIDLFSVSPKLGNALLFKSSLQPKYNVQSFIDIVRDSLDKDLQIKFVVADIVEQDKIHKFLSHLVGWKNEDILIMPAGTTNEMLQKTSKPALEISISNGWRYTPRLHIALFGDKRKV